MVFEIPKKVKVGAFEFQVVQSENVRDSDDDSCLGLIKHDELVIELDNICKRPAQESFIHEVIHAIDRNAGESLEERQVAMLGTGLYLLLLDNPGLFDKNK